MSNKRNIPIVRKELLFPFIIITSLFALWGIANDLTNPMVSAFKKVMPELSNVQASLVQFAFYFGYFFMALPAALFIRKYSYKSGIILGLSLYAIGAFLFYPAAENEQFNYFLISLWIITCGLAFLETTSNPLILSMGDKETATQRLNLAQAFNPIGSLTGMIIAQVFVIEALRSDDFTNEAYNALTSKELAAIRENDLEIISIPYIALGVLVLIIMGIIIFTKMPKTSEKDKMSLSESFHKLFANKNYKQGVITQAFYVGAQIMCWTYVYQYVDNINDTLGLELTATYFNVTAMIIFLTGRWIGLDEYIAVVKKSGITPLLGVNITSGYQFNRVEESIERAVKMVNHVKDAGLDGAFWYLGNEGKNGGLESEAQLFVQHAKAMKAADPTIKLMFNQNHLTPSYLKKYLAIAGDYIDIVETHGKWPYGGTPKGYEPGTYEEWQVESPLRDRKNSNRVWRDQISLLQKAAEEAGYTNIKFANNEYGIGKGSNVLGFDRYSKSLLVVDMLQEFFIGNWYMTCYWSQLRSSSEESVKSSARENYRFNPMHIGFELLAKAQGGSMLEMSNLDGNKSVYGFAAKKGDEYLVYILNKSDNNQEMVLNFNNKQKLVFVDGKSMVNTQDKFGKMISTAIDSNDQKNSFKSNLKPMSYTRFTFKTK